MDQQSTHRTQIRDRVSQALGRVRQAAKERRKEKFTALLHHVDVDLLRLSFQALKRKAAPGVDGVTWQDYEADLESNLLDLHARVHRGAYRAQPSRRKYILKSDGRQRPLGIASVEDKILQRAVVTVLNSIYEEDFLGFSYGFRPNRSQHDALDARMSFFGTLSTSSTPFDIAISLISHLGTIRYSGYSTIEQFHGVLKELLASLLMPAVVKKRD